MKILADNQPRLYELTYLFPGDMTDAEVKTASAQVESLVEKHGGKVLQSENWGNRELAYRIKHNGKRQAKGAYMFAIVQFLPENTQKFETELKHNEDLLRHLLVVSENQDEKNLEASGNVAGEKSAERAEKPERRAVKKPSEKAEK